MIVLYVFLCLLAITLCFLFYIFNAAFYNPPSRRHKKIKMDRRQYNALGDKVKEPVRLVKSAEYETVSVVSFDGYVLTGKYFHYKDGAPLDIIFHGYRSDSYNDCGGGYKLARDLGHNVLLPDQRSHGKSECNIITFGVNERYDCVSWCKYASERFKDVKIVISGVSMGAATVLMASDLDLPKNVKGIIADCGFSRPIDIILEVGRTMGISPKIASFFVTFAAKILGGFDIHKTSAVQAVKNAKVPILIVHGDEDRLVPVDMAYKIYDACNSPKQLMIVKGAGHGLSYIIEEEKYRETINRFKTAVINDDYSIFE